MPPGYQVRLYDSAGALQAVLSTEQDLLSATIHHTVNEPSTLQLQLYGLSRAIKYFTLDTLVEIRREVPEASLSWYTEYIGFHRTPQHQIQSNDQRVFTSYSVGLLDLIRRRSIRYHADTDGSDKGPGPADDIIKAFVRENAGPLATVTNRRATDGVTYGLSVQADASQAASFSGAFPWHNLLESITQIGQPNKVDFDVVWLGGLNSEFKTYYPQRGTDRRMGTSDPFVFSTDLGNMLIPSYLQQRIGEISSALVLGPGAEPLRDTTLRLSTHTGDSLWNTIEADIDDSGEDILVALQAKGDAALYDKRPAVTFTFDTLQTPHSAYAKNYFLGDLVTARFNNLRSDVKIKGVTLTLDGSRERIALVLEEVPQT